jgi:hypothetical protein
MTQSGCEMKAGARPAGRARGIRILDIQDALHQSYSIEAFLDTSLFRRVNSFNIPQQTHCRGFSVGVKRLI